MCLSKIIIRSSSGVRMLSLRVLCNPVSSQSLNFVHIGLIGDFKFCAGCTAQCLLGHLRTIFNMEQV